MKLTLARALASVALTLAAAELQAQATILVPLDQPTIQLGISAAANGDTVLVSPGTYQEQIDLLGKKITVRSLAGPSVTTIDSAGGSAWPDFPYGPVVRMVQGEGPSTVLEGFTITGASDPFGSTGTCGIWCAAADPTVRDCVVTNNQGGNGAGIHGNARIEGCQIVFNSATPYGDGGGVFGVPTVTDSVIANNKSGSRGGGVYVQGPCSIVNTRIEANVAGNGTDGYSGGGVYGPATLERCAIVGNVGNHYVSGGPPDEVGTAVDGAVELVHCTVSDNTIGGGAVAGDPSGALRNVGSVTNCILWSNENAELSASSATAVTWSIVTGGAPGVGNLSADPLFAAPGSGDYTLTAGSPAIDAGSPAFPLDPDGTAADMGAYVYLQAWTQLVLGSGANPQSYLSSSPPAIGATWSAAIDATLHDPSTFACGILGVLPPLATPLATVYGELLINPLSSPVLSVSQSVAGGSATFGVPVPAQAALIGVTVHTQGLALGTGVELTNGIDLHLGH